MRFPGFEGEWDKNKLGNIATNKSPKFNPNKATNIVKCIELEHISGKTGELLGFTDGSQSGSIKNVFCKGDVLFGKLRPYLRKYIQAPFDGVCSSEIWVLKGKSITNSFLYQIVQTEKFIDLANQSSGSKMPRADWSVVQDGDFSFPTQKEQEKISSFLALVNERILTQSKIIEELKSSKDILVKKIFSHKLKFKNDTGNGFADWKCLSLGEVTTLVNNRNKKNEKLPVYSINNKIGFTPQRDQFEGVDSNARGYDIKIYKIIDKATFAYNPARINVGSIGYSGELERIIISSLYVCFKTKEDLDDNFLLQYLKTDMFNKQVLENMEGGVRSYLFLKIFLELY